MSRSVLTRATNAVANRLDRRSFLTRSALVGSALVAAPTDVLLRPKSAYAAICRCQGQSCQCGSLCCDGYTEFCCAIYGVNHCPTGSIMGGWWKADGSSFCGGAARYYMDCHKPCGGCTCGGSGICSGSCNGTPCGCALGRCDHRKAGCTSFRYGNCSNHIACIGPIQCRVVTCTPPWQLEPSCSSSAVRTDNNTRSHNRPCLQQVPPIFPVAGNWDGVGGDGIGFYDARTGRWTLRQSPGGSDLPGFAFGRQPGDLPVTGNWDGVGGDGVGIVRDNIWHLTDQAATSATDYRSPRYGQPGDLPVVGDWNGDGTDSIGVFRPTVGTWYLSDHLTSSFATYSFRYGRAGDRPVVGDWDGDGVDGIGVFRNGFWYLSNRLRGGDAEHVIGFGRPDDIPVVGDWQGTGRSGIGVYRPSVGTWYLRPRIDDPATVTVVWGPRWTVG
ncbi:MAG: hypothetical protein ACLGI8_13060 [Acidimicrobiia bacterium]|jgi:hypothetical protein